MVAALTRAIVDPARLDELVRLRLLDTPPEEPFDRLTRLAAQLLGAPVALLSLVDEHRQFFKSCIGLPEPWCTRRETPLSHSFCQHVVARAEPLVVEDAREHPLVRDNLAVRDLDVIAYAGVPLTTPSGRTIGSLCVVASKPVRWRDQDLATLKVLAASVMSEIALRCALDELLAVNKRLRLEAAAREAALVELANSEARLQTAQRLAHVGNFELWAVERPHAHWSAEALRIMALGREPPPSSIAEFVERIVHPDDRMRVASFLHEAMAGRAKRAIEYRARRGDGATRVLATVIEPLPEPDNGGAVMCTALDITTRIESEAAIMEQRGQLLHLARVATAGEMAAVMAHEVNQPLAAISHTANACERLLNRQHLSTQELTGHLADIGRQAKRASEIIGRIGGFVQKKPSTNMPLAVERVISDVVSLLAPMCWRQSIRITRKEPPSPVIVMADEIQFVQLLANVVRNAFDAVAGNADDERCVAISTAYDGDGCVMLEVADNGVGIPLDKREQIFEPFFSTRADGLGMGLAIARTIADAHGATLTLKPDPPKGWSTVFCLRMPAMPLE